MTKALALRSQQDRPCATRLVSFRDAAAIASMAVRCLLLELETWPKPGLVSHIAPGSHADMNAGTFCRSAAAIHPFLHALAEAGAQGCGMGRLRVIGLDAEAAMFAATNGVNTHRGAIFGFGLLCAAAGARAAGRTDPAMPLGVVVSRLWGSNILNGPVLLHSHGGGARRRYGAGGARLEAAQGFPSVYKIGLPALKQAALIAPGNAEAARVQACFALIAALEDTNLLHRAGPSVFRFAQRAARIFLEGGGVSTFYGRKRASIVHRSFVARRLSPGG